MSTFKLNILEQGRATEWLSSSVLLAFALALAAPGDTLSSTTGFRGFVELGLDDASLAVPVALVASVRIVALHINGRWQRSPALRMVGAILGAAIFSMISMVFLWPTLVYGVGLSTGVLTYFTLALSDGLAAYRSGADVRMAKQLFGRA